MTSPVSTSHAAHMDAIYRRQRHFYDITREYYLLGRNRLIATLDVPLGGVALEIGCGTGRNLIHAARRYPHAHFYGLDISAAMLETATAAIDRAGLRNRITLACGDATIFDPVASFGRDNFDRVYFSYTLSMIPDWRAALQHAATMIGADGQLHLVDFGQQEGLPKWFGHILHAWLRQFSVTPPVGLPNELAAISRQVSRKLSFEPLYHGYAWAAQI